MTRDDDRIDTFFVQSLEDHPPLHRKALLKAAELAEPAVRLRPPFDRVVNTRLWPRTRHAALDGPDVEEREALLEAMIASVKFSMCGEAFGDQGRFKRLRAFDDSRRDSAKFLRDTAEFAKYPPRDPRLRVEPVIVDVMKTPSSGFQARQSTAEADRKNRKRGCLLHNAIHEVQQASYRHRISFF